MAISELSQVSLENNWLFCFKTYVLKTPEFLESIQSKFQIFSTLELIKTRCLWYFCVYLYEPLITEMHLKEYTFVRERVVLSLVQPVVLDLVPVWYLSSTLNLRYAQRLAINTIFYN